MLDGGAAPHLAADRGDDPADVGLLHPIVVTSRGHLFAGARRLEACRLLGWKKIPVTVLELPNG
jgi:ParB family chromosome partitioning protein